jgi:hypothetical protein
VTHICTYVDSEPEEQESEDEAIGGREGSSAPLLKRQKNTHHITMRPICQSIVASTPMIPTANNYSGMGVPYQGSNWMPPPWGTWMPLQGSGWVLAPPGQYMQPPNMLDVQCGLQSIPESAIRTNRRHKRKGIDADTRERIAVGKKPYQVRVKVGGEIDGGCAGKNAWDSAVRSAVPRTLDMSILSWEGQSTDAIDELREHLDRDFEYVGYSLSMQGFRSAVKKYMRQERSHLRTRYREGHKHCPLHIEEEQWTRLMNYWEADTTMEKSKKMSKARSSVATQDRVLPHYVPNSSIKHSKSDSKDRSQEICRALIHRAKMTSC